MSSPWGKIQKPEIPVSFAEIMSEDVARNLQNKENELHRKFLDIGKLDEAGPPILYDTQIDENIPDEVLKAISNDSIESDAAIAQMLQMQFDKEYDDTLKRKEQKLNGTSKVSISLENYKRAPHNFDFESDSEPEEIEDIQDRKDWDRFDTLQKVIDSIPGCGYKVQQNGTLITKHDLVNNGRKNACKLLSFPPEFQTGDGETFDLKLSNKVYNSLKKHSKKEQVRRYRIDTKKEDRATAEFGMDEYTRLLIYKMVNGGLLDSVNGVISIGKEAVIIHVDSNTDFPDVQEPLPKECVLKVFKTTLAEFKRRDQYIKDDHRFKDKIGKKTSKKNINVWVEKEMANLLRLQRVGIKCPKVITVKKHILLMSFIGEKNRPAPKLKDAIMSDADYSIAYEEVKC
ncbi:serine/threonine-protein kinase RIO3-like [Sitophilus oryzae]|uniref:non-specific serine/threonine protein kinase n=1 Tax=Sitophilus oryzae TaxID=7048 RepID=A0A6J2XJY4_SITOR|nr:serine/threonine-protein kinase RIO3-like [Sitophilus oryzae]